MGNSIAENVNEYTIRNDGLHKKRHYGEKNKKSPPLKIDAIFLDNVIRTWDPERTAYAEKIFHLSPSANDDFQKNWKKAMKGSDRRWKMVGCEIDRKFKFKLIFLDMDSDEWLPVVDEIVIGNTSDYKAITLCLSNFAVKSEIDYSWGEKPMAYVQEYNDRGTERRMVLKPRDSKNDNN